MPRIFLQIAKRARIDALGVAMPGPRLPARIRTIVEADPIARLSRLRGACLVAFCVTICAAFFALTLVHAQSSIGPIPQWEVVSVKPCQNQAAIPGLRSSSGTPPAPPASFSPNRMSLNCQTLTHLIQNAYLIFPTGQRPANQGFAGSTPIDSLPDWASAERYSIEASTESIVTPTMMEGPMLQAILESRFKLKLHHETREVPVYDLVVAKGGPKLAPFDPASCIQPPPVADIVTGPRTPRPQLPAGQSYCSHSGGLRGPNAANIVIQADGTTLDNFCKDFLESVGDDGRRAIDKTGLTGEYTIHFEYAPGGATRDRMMADGVTPPDPTAPEIFTAIQEQLGLKLVPDKGPGDFLVIDHAEQPTPN